MAEQHHFEKLVLQLNFVVGKFMLLYFEQIQEEVINSLKIAGCENEPSKGMESMSITTELSSL